MMTEQMENKSQVECLSWHVNLCKKFISLAMILFFVPHTSTHTHTDIYITYKDWAHLWSKHQLSAARVDVKQLFRLLMRLHLQTFPFEACALKLLSCSGCLSVCLPYADMRTLLVLLVIMITVENVVVSCHHHRRGSCLVVSSGNRRKITVVLPYKND